MKAKEELWKFKYFTMQKYIIFKKSSKRNQNKSFKIFITLYTLISKLQHKPKYDLSKILITK
jgi:hypothetical protein